MDWFLFYKYKLCSYVICRKKTAGLEEEERKEP